jgi:ABC-type antimicrobial peptide transport system permease subunit
VLFGIEPTDPLTYGLVIVAMLAVAVIASAVPARRAATVDPAIAFRSD